MPPGKDSGLDKPNWQELDPSTATARRRKSITGVDIQSRKNRTYLQATSPKFESAS